MYCRAWDRCVSHPRSSMRCAITPAPHHLGRPRARRKEATTMRMIFCLVPERKASSDPASGEPAVQSSRDARPTCDIEFARSRTAVLDEPVSGTGANPTSFRRALRSHPAHVGSLRSAPSAFASILPATTPSAAGLPPACRHAESFGDLLHMTLKGSCPKARAAEAVFGARRNRSSPMGAVTDMRSPSPQVAGSHGGLAHGPWR
jgi:hypothetical protein